MLIVRMADEAKSSYHSDSESQGQRLLRAPNTTIKTSCRVKHIKSE